MIYGGGFGWARRSTEVDFVNQRGNLIFEIKIHRKFKFLLKEFNCTGKYTLAEGNLNIAARKPILKIVLQHLINVPDDKLLHLMTQIFYKSICLFFATFPTRRLPRRPPYHC